MSLIGPHKVRSTVPTEPCGTCPSHVGRHTQQSLEATRKWWNLFCSSLHFPWVVDDVKCTLVTAVCVFVWLSLAAFSHYCTDPYVTWGNGRRCPVVVHYWADLQSVHGFRCYDNIAPNANVSECLYSLYAWFTWGGVILQKSEASILELMQKRCSNVEWQTSPKVLRIRK